MLLCWKVLVPVKNFDGFKNATTSLEQMSRRPELIKPAQSGGTPVSAPDDGGARLQLMIPHFYLP
jgi:hypothetical protein